MTLMSKGFWEQNSEEIEKTLRHALRYGMGADRMRSFMGADLREVERVLGDSYGKPDKDAQPSDIPKRYLREMEMHKIELAFNQFVMREARGEQELHVSRWFALRKKFNNQLIEREMMEQAQAGKYSVKDFNEKIETQDVLSPIYDLLNVLQTGYTTVQVQFHDSAKVYTYKAPLGLVAGQEVVVKVRGHYALATIKAIDESPTFPKAGIRYKWIVQVVDGTTYDNQLATEEAFIKQTQESSRITRVNSLLTQLRSEFGEGGTAREGFEAALKAVTTPVSAVNSALITKE